MDPGCAGDHLTPNDAAPVEISHPALFVPNAEAVAAAPARAGDARSRGRGRTAKTADPKKSAATTAREAASLTASLRKLEWLKPHADAELAFADKALAAAKTDQAKARAEELKQKAHAKAAEAGTQLDRAKADAKSKLDAAAAAKDAANAAETKKADAAKAASEAKLALEPVSVYISRATQKLYVRRNTHKPWPDGGEVFDTTIEVPVTIRIPDKPFGTHVSPAMARNDAGLRWSAVTIDDADDAKDALDRITIPQDVLDRVAPTALPRSSIIVSDEPLSRETNYRTEFVAVLNNQPQGGFLMRRPTVAVPVASGNYWEPTTSSAPFSRAIGTRNLPIRVRAPANTINRRNSAGGKTRHAASRPYGRSRSLSIASALDTACKSLFCTDDRKFCGLAGAPATVTRRNHYPTRRALREAGQSDLGRTALGRATRRPSIREQSVGNLPRETKALRFVDR